MLSFTSFCRFYVYPYLFCCKQVGTKQHLSGAEFHSVEAALFFIATSPARLSLNMYPNASAGNVATVLINNITTQHCELGGEVLRAGEGGATAHINILGPGNHHKSPLQAPSVYVRETLTSFVLHCKSSASPPCRS